jgi:hypothetical protein
MKTKQIADRVLAMTRCTRRGQSLVELAITLPLLLLMLLGVFEVGWALRGYLTLVNGNREAARFATRGVYLDFNEKADSKQVGYETVVTHTVETLASQLNAMNFLDINPDDNASMIITYYSVSPIEFGCPGDEADEGTCAEFECQNFLDWENNLDAFVDAGTHDDIRNNNDVEPYIDSLNTVEYPLLVTPAGYDDGSYDVPAFYDTKIDKDTEDGLDDYYEAVPAYHYHTGGPYFSRFDPAEQVAEFVAQNNQLNCERVKKGLPEDELGVVVVENFYQQPLLVGLPFVTAFIGDDIPMYTHTAMRINPAVREQADADSCGLYPLMIPFSTIADVARSQRYGQEVIVPLDNDGTGIPGSFSWLAWDGGDPSADADQNGLEKNIQNPNRAFKLYNEPRPPSPKEDLALDAPIDWLATNPGMKAATKDEFDLIEVELKKAANNDQVMYFPIWDDTDCLVTGKNCKNFSDTGGKGSQGRYKLFGFAQLRLKTETPGGIFLTGNNSECGPKGGKCLIFTYHGVGPGPCHFRMGNGY